MAPTQRKLYEERLARLSRFSNAALRREAEPTPAKSFNKPQPSLALLYQDATPATLFPGHPNVRTEADSETLRCVTMWDIQCAVVQRYHVSRADLLSSKRTADVVRPRQVAMYLAKTLTHRSFPKIGRYFQRDHASVFYSAKRIAWLIGERNGPFPNCWATLAEANLVPIDLELKSDVEALKQQLLGG